MTQKNELVRDTYKMIKYNTSKISYTKVKYCKYFIKHLIKQLRKLLLV